MPRSRSAVSAGRALAALALFAGVGLSEATYYGRYNRYGGTAVVRTATVVRRPRYGWGRRLLRDDPAEAPLASALEASAPAPGADEDEADCLTVLDVVRGRPELSLLAETLEKLPRVRAALDDPTRTDTFFAPTDDAVEELLKWGGFVEKAKGIDEMLGDVPLTALIVAYHAVPNATIFSPGLAERGGDAADAADRFLDTALASVLEAASASSADAETSASTNAPGSEPLLVDEYQGDLFLKAVGSEAKVLVRDIKACGSVVHTIDAVLLPIDGDAELEPFQEERLAKIKARAEAAEARSGDARSYETEEEEDDEEDTETSYADVLEDAAAPAPA
jgi:uncharacterized surface protein with fasciclin (FAS1) repeats